MTSRTVPISLQFCARVGGLLLICWGASLACRSIASQQASGYRQTPIIRTESSLVLVDVIGQDPKDGLPVRDFQKEDFRVFDNRQAVPIATFDAGAAFGTRPVVVWLVAICNELGKSEAPPNTRETRHCFGLRSTTWTNTTRSE
jgi:hypothetical protein